MGWQTIVVLTLAAVGVIAIMVAIAKWWRSFLRCGIGLLVIGAIFCAAFIPLWGFYHVQEVLSVERMESVVLTITTNDGNPNILDILVIENGTNDLVNDVSPTILLDGGSVPTLEYDKIKVRTWFGEKYIYENAVLHISDPSILPERY